MALFKKKQPKKVLGDEPPVVETAALEEVATPASSVLESIASAILEPAAPSRAVRTYKALGTLRLDGGECALRLIELDENNKLISVKELRRGRDVNILMEQFKIESIRHKVMKPESI